MQRVDKVRQPGEALMNAVEQWARASGSGTVSLYSGAQRVDAHRFYERLGYAVELRAT